MNAHRGQVELDAARMPGHWLLASLGKKVLRPGGIELTADMIRQLRPGPQDDIVEFAPGMGATARKLLAARPGSYTGVDRDESVVQRLSAALAGPSVRFHAASAEQTGLPAGSASIVFGEAMLSMQTKEQKERIGAEAHRLLKPGGRYAIHELALLPDGIAEATRREIEREMSMNIHVGVRPLTAGEWKTFLENLGFTVSWRKLSPMHLLEPGRVLADEGLGGMLTILANVVRKPDARRRVLAMRGMFKRYAAHLSAVAFVATKG